MRSTDLPTLELESPTDDNSLLQQQLLERGMISDELASSELLDQFGASDTGQSALRHILAGDATGGCHHLPTLLALGVENGYVQVSSRFYESTSQKTVEQQRRDNRSQQKFRGNGIFKAKIVEYVDRDGSIARKAGDGSMFFPNEWSTETVIEAILEVATRPAQVEISSRLDADSEYIIHTGEYAGVALKVVLRKQDGKIISSFPIRK